MSTVSTPAAAARTGARPKMMNGGPASVSVSVAAPPPPVRKKKKSSAPSPPSSRGGRPVNSTMTSSATSLLSVKEDISYIRPQSAMSVASLSSVSTVRSHKKRRAPPPPVKITTVVDAAEIVPPSDSVDNTVNVNGYSHDNHDVYATVHKITKEDTITINDEVIADDGANDGYEFGESAIILSDENEDGDHIYEKIDFTNSVSNNSYDDQDFVDEIPVFQSDLLSIEDNSKSTAQDLEEEKSELNVSTEDKGTPRSEIDQGETISIEQVKINREILSNEDASKSEQEEKKKDKKKKKSKDKTSKDKSKKKKKKDETTTEDLGNSAEFAHKKTKDIVLKREQSDTKNAENNYTEPELPSFRGAKAAKVHEINEVEENSEEKRSASSPALDNVESDALVDSDDDLVDLFTIASRSKQQNKSAASDIKNADSAKQEKQRDNKLMDDMTSDDELAELANNLGDSTYLSEEEELQDKLKSVPKKLSGKEIEEMKKNEIRQSMPTTSSILNNRKVSEVYLEMKSEEALRHELKILQLGDTDPAAQQQPGRRRVELDIELEEEEVLVLGSLPSSRASSVANLEEAAQAEARRELDHQFAVRELQARAGAGVRTVEAEEDEEKYLTVHDAVIMESELRDADAAVSSDNEVTQSPAPRIEEPRVSAEVPEILNINVGQHDLGTVTRDAGGDRDNNGGADSIKSPSPDSGIHDFTDSCSSPVSCAAQEDGAAAGPSNAANWSQLGDIHIKAQEAAVIGLDRVELRQDYRGHEEPPPDSGDVSEKVEMPKTHNLNRVLFSMSSYNDRKCVEQSGDLFRTQSYSALADKLNTSLAARQKLKHAGAGGLVPGTGPGETKPPVPARNFGKKYAGSSSSRGQGGARPQPGPHPPSPDAGLTHAAAAAGQSAARNPISRPHAAHADTAAASFRSRIIEEFQAKKGVLILGRSHSSGSSAPAPPAADPGMEHYSSLDRGGGHLARARPRREEESHYASPRALLGPSVSLGVWGARQQQQDSSSGHLQLSPPAASSSSSSGPHPALQQHKQIEIRYKNGQAKEVIEDPRKFVLQGSRTSRGDYKNEAGFQTHRGHVTEDTGRPKQHEHYDLEPAIIPKVKAVTLQTHFL